MGVLGATNVAGMAVFTVLLVALALWAQSFRKQPRNIIGSRRIFLTISGVLILICIGGMVYRQLNGGYNLGMDFTGGTVIEVGFYEHTDTLTTHKIAEAIMQVDPTLKEPQVQLEEQVLRGGGQSAPAAGGSPAAPASASPGPSASPAGKSQGWRPMGSVPVQLEASPAAGASAAPSMNPATGSPAAPASASAAVTSSPASSESASPTATATPAAPTGSYLPAIIRLGKKNYEPLKSTEIDELLAKLGPVLGRTTAPLSVDSISPIIGSELFKSGMLAILIALGLQLIYITLRFGNQWSYGIAADVALVHDLIIMMGFYVIFNRQIDSPFLAAILTVIGYSVMDSIVIFDRIRENVRLNRKADFEEVVNKSVNETMTRSINTLMTVLLCLFALYFLGESTLRNFAFALLVGITSGAYSSIFIASPILVMWDKASRRRESAAVAQRRANLAAQPGDRPARDTEEDEDARAANVGRTDRQRRGRASARRRRG